MKKVLLSIFCVVVFFLGDVKSSKAQDFYFQGLARPWSYEFGVGPGWTYADNSGAFRSTNFKISPSVSASMAKDISKFISLKGTIGFQHMVGNLDTDPILDAERRSNWGAEGNSYHFQGQAYHLDFAPVFRLFLGGPNIIKRSQFNIYGSAGIGAMGIVSHNLIMQNDSSMKRRNNMFIPYIPIRGGVSYGFRPQWEMALEGSVLLTNRDDIDGHEGFNTYNDHLMSLQIKVRKHFSFDY